MASHYSSYSYGALSTQYRVTDKVSTRKTAFKEASIVAFEVPEGAIPFTTELRIEKDTDTAMYVPIVYIMIDDIKKNLAYFGGEFVKKNVRLYNYFGKVRFSFVGYLLTGEAAARYGVKDGEIYITDCYLNSNFMDHPLLDSLVGKLKLNMAPVLISNKPFDEKEVDDLIGKPSLIKSDLTVSKVLVKRYIEDVEGTVGTYSRLAAYHEGEKKTTFFPPAVTEASTTTTTVTSTETEVVDGLELLPPADHSDFTAHNEAISEINDDGFSDVDIDKFLDECETQSLKAEEDRMALEEEMSRKKESDKKKNEEFLRESINDMFEYYFSKDQLIRYFSECKINVSKETYFVLFSSVKSKFVSELLSDSTYQENIAPKFSFNTIDKSISLVTRGHLKEWFGVP